MSVGFSTFLSVLISTISVKIIWLPSEKGLDYATGRDGNAAKTLLAALLIFFPEVPARAAFRFAKSKGLRESLCELRPILSKMARARSTINLETEWGSSRLGR